ncbi:MAG: hypothetical protein CL823_01395 [Crocinitomicaceae bacterium]|nr:hypothetical protein [Crocinitomicaceae bacterium]
MEWMKPKYYYLGLMLLSISYPLLRSFENRLRFYKNWKQLGISILCMMLIFITWDIVFTQLSIWSFTDKYILGIKLMHLPIEEWMFFVFVPYACVFIHEVLLYFFPLKHPISLIKKINILLAFILLTVGIFFFDKTYTCVCFISCGGFLIFFQRNSDLFLTSVYRTYIVSLIPFFIVNGILTGSITNEPIVKYYDSHITTVRILTIPIEDFIYCFLMLGVTIWIYELLKHKKKQDGLTLK